jgi:putative transposase
VGAKKLVTAQQRREGVKYFMEQGLTIARCCALVELGRSSFYYQAEEDGDEELLSKLRQIAREHKRYGYRRAWALLRREGQRVNIKRIHRLWKKAGLGLPRKRLRKRLRKGTGTPLQALYPNHVWTYDFMEDATMDGRKLRILTVVDEFTRESLAIVVERSMTSEQVIEVLRRLFAQRGAPEYLRSDNGPEFIAQAVQEWLASRGTKPYYIDPGCPWQNPYGESFNDKLRTECLNMELFGSLAEAKIEIERWRRAYNRERPHSSLGYQTPQEYRAAWEAKRGKEFSFSPAPGSLRSPWVRAGRKGKTMVGVTSD